VIGTGVNGRLIETCAASATKPAPPSTRRTLVSRLERGKTASRRVAASGLMPAAAYPEVGRMMYGPGGLPPGPYTVVGFSGV
jgi:hypothetical protein